MPPSSIVTAKVPKRLKAELERSGVNVSDAIRKGLEYMLREKKVEELEKLLEGIDLSGLSNEQIVSDIRRGRERAVAKARKKRPPRTVK